MKRRILVVHDTPRTLDNIVRWLGSEGRIVDGVASVGEALSMLARERYDLVVTDLWLDGDSDEEGGLRILRASLSDNEERPVIIVTARGTDELGPKCLEAGAYDYINRTSDRRHAFLERLELKVAEALSAAAERGEG